MNATLRFIASGFILISLTQIVGCTGNSSGTSTNAGVSSQENNKRKQVGIRTIKPTWSLVTREFGEDKWSYNSNSYAKIVKRLADDAIEWEQDYYYTGKQYTTTDGDGAFEFLTIHYDYALDEVSILLTTNNAALQAHTARMAKSSYGLVASNNSDTLRIAKDILVDMGITSSTASVSNAINAQAW